MLVFALVMSCFCPKTGFLSLFGVLATPIPIFWHFGIFAKSAKIDISELHFAQSRKSEFGIFENIFAILEICETFFLDFEILESKILNSDSRFTISQFSKNLFPPRPILKTMLNPVQHCPNPRPIPREPPPLGVRTKRK